MQMSRFIRYALLVSELYLSLGQWTGMGGSMSPAAQAAPQFTSATVPAGNPPPAARLFRRSCASCHGEDFTGEEFRPIAPEIPDFTRKTWQASRTDVQLLVSILDGRGKRMPSFQGRLNSTEVRDLVAYIRQAGPPGSAPPKAAPGSALPKAWQDDFDRRFAALVKELDDLREQFWRLAPTAKPALKIRKASPPFPK
jgi:mono/diheme cytochrome c family protein